VAEPSAGEEAGSAADGGRVLSSLCRSLASNTPPLYLTLCSALFNGTFGVFTKLRNSRPVSPVALNHWMAEGVVLSGLFVLAVPPRVRVSVWQAARCIMAGTLLLEHCTTRILMLSLHSFPPKSLPTAMAA